MDKQFWFKGFGSTGCKYCYSDPGCESVSHSRAECSANGFANADAPENDTRAPHFGVHQFGFRGPRVTLSENTVVGLAYGYAVIPSLSSDLAGVWRLRDNAAAQVSFPYVFGTGVQVI